MDVKLDSKLIFKLSVDCDPAMEIGKTDKGYFKVIPITGGTFEGDGLGDGIKGEVISGGADWNSKLGGDVVNNPRSSHVFAKYVIKTDDGTYIAIENEGFKGLKEGESTNIVTNPRFQVEAGKYEWLNYGVYVGSLAPREDKTGVEISIYKMM